jgi:hypothetical protein
MLVEDAECSKSRKCYRKCGITDINNNWRYSKEKTKPLENSV